jgi:hypothetical protein
MTWLDFFNFSPSTSLNHDTELELLVDSGKMQRLESSRVSHWARKLATDSEPGLSNTQLLLVNHDLKPVEPERRQWGFWNFVGFWIADCFNIV